MNRNLDLGPGVIDPEHDLPLEGDVEQRGRLIAYYLEQIAEELPGAMICSGGETFSWLYKSAKRIGEIADEEFRIAELD